MVHTFADRQLLNTHQDDLHPPLQVLLSQALFGAMSMVTMPLCMYRLNSRATDAKKKL